jgi:hypothetical protein
MACLLACYWNIAQKTLPAAYIPRAPRAITFSAQCIGASVMVTAKVHMEHSRRLVP